MMTYRTITALTASLGMALFAGAAAAQPAVAYDGLKKTVAVDQFLAAESVGGAVTADGMTAMLTAALVKDGRFVVLERMGIASVLAEQSIGQSGAANMETAAKPGQLIGAGAVVRGVVTKFEAAASGGGVGIGGLPMGSLFAGAVALKSRTAVMEISLRLLDSTTGQVISTSTAQGTADSTSAEATMVTNTGIAASGGGFQNSPMGQAGEQAIVKAVEQIAAGMRHVAWSALVVDASDGTVYVNAGANRNMQPGMVLHVYRKGKVLTDPSTGVVLDVDIQKIGLIRIVGVREKLSTASLVNGEIPTRGNLLKLE